MSQYDIYNQVRNNLLEIARDQLAITHGLKFDEGQKIEEALENLIGRLNFSPQFRVLLVGVLNSGKTTFINALIGERLLPTAKVPATAVLCRILYGEPNEKKITLYPKPGLNAPNDGKPFDIKIEQLREYITIDHEKSDGDAESPYDCMEMYWPLPLCQNGIELIDSVGLGDRASRDKITMDYLNKADAVLFLMPCGHSCGGKDMAAIQGIRTMGFTSPFFILTHADSLDDEDDGGASVRAYVKKHLVDKTDFGEKGILYVNSLEAIAAKIAGNEEKIKKTGIREIESAIEDFLVREKGRSKIFRNLLSLQEQNRFVSEAIHLRDRMLRQSVGELKKRLQNTRESLQVLKYQKDNLLEWTRTTIDRVAMDIYATVETYFSELPRKIETWSNEYQIQNSVGIFPRISTITPIVEEVAEHLRMKGEEDITKWIEEELAPLIAEEVERIDIKINESGLNFQGAVDGHLNFEGAIDDLLKHIVGYIVGVYILNLTLSLMFLPAAILIVVAGALPRFVGSDVGNTIKKTICKKMVENLEQTRHQSAKKVQDQVRSSLMEGIYTVLNDVMEGDISSLENEITIQIEECNKASFDIETERQTLETALTKNAALQQRLSRFAHKIVALS